MPAAALTHTEQHPGWTRTLSEHRGHPEVTLTLIRLIRKEKKKKHARCAAASCCCEPVSQLHHPHLVTYRTPLSDLNLPLKKKNKVAEERFGDSRGRDVCGFSTLNNVTHVDNEEVRRGSRSGRHVFLFKTTLNSPT